MTIRIRAKRAGFRRCGIAHPAEWTEHPDGIFTGEEIARLSAEPMLEVQVIPEPVKTAEPTGDDRIVPLAGRPKKRK